MENQSPILRFGIAVDGKRSSYWRLRAGTKRPELFLEREAYGKKWHISLHASGDWHLKESRKERIVWRKPPEVVPGYTHALGIVQPVVIAHHEEPPAEEVVLVPVAAGSDATVFSVFIERPGANQSTWPGKNAQNSSFVGRLPLAAEAGTCVVVTTQAPLEPGSVRLARPADEQLRDMREWAVNGVLVTTIVGEMSGGAIALVDLRASDDVAATIDRALP